MIISPKDKVRVSSNRKPFTNILNSTLRDKNLSLRSIGLLCHILSHDRDSYELSVKGLMATVKDGRVSIESSINELVEQGYGLKIEKPRVSGRFDGYILTFSDNKLDLEHSEPLSIHRSGATESGATVAAGPSRSISTKELTIERTNNERTNKEERTLEPNFVGQTEISSEESARITFEAKFKSYLEMCNKELAIDGKPRKFKPDNKTKRQFLAMLESGYVGTDFISAMRNARKTQNHIESGFKWLTPEFFTRPDKLQTYANVVEVFDKNAEAKMKWKEKVGDKFII